MPFPLVSRRVRINHNLLTQQPLRCHWRFSLRWHGRLATNQEKAFGKKQSLFGAMNSRKSRRLLGEVSWTCFLEARESPCKRVRAWLAPAAHCALPVALSAPRRRQVAREPAGSRSPLSESQHSTCPVLCQCSPNLQWGYADSGWNYQHCWCQVFRLLIKCR